MEQMDKKELVLKVNMIVEEAKDMKNAYFFHSPQMASGRRQYEERHSHDMVEWTEGGNTYTAQYTVSCSCANIYAKGIYTKNGKTTTLTAIKNSLKRLDKELEELKNE